MYAKISKNFDFELEKECFGVVFQVRHGSRYCKYLSGHQAYETRKEARDLVKKYNQDIFNDKLELSCIKSINTAEYVYIKYKDDRE